MRSVRLEHQPIFMMVVLLSPYSFRDMPPPALREWTLTRSGLIPAWRSLRAETDNRMTIMISVCVTMEKLSLLVTMY